VSTIRGADAVMAAYDRAIRTVPQQVLATVTGHGAMLQTRVKAAASGRPGPRVITGNYRRSIGLELGGRSATATATVGTNAPQGRRLEHGFYGADALGRLFRQPPLPHFGPSFRVTAPEFTAALHTLIAQYGRPRS